MEKVVAVVYDNRVYEALNHQLKINRRVAIFGLITTVYIIGQQLTLMEQKRQIQKLMNPEGE